MYEILGNPKSVSLLRRSGGQIMSEKSAFCGSKKNPKSSIVDRSNRFKDKIPWYNRAENEKVDKLHLNMYTSRFRI